MGRLREWPWVQGAWFTGLYSGQGYLRSPDLPPVIGPHTDQQPDGQNRKTLKSELC